MDNIKYEYILKINELGSFTKAAEELYIAQPSLSRYISNLEKRLEIKIFDRSKNPIGVTKPGQILIDYIHKYLELKKNMLEEINEYKLVDKKELKIGVVPWRIPLFLPRIIPEFSKCNSNYSISIKEDVSTNLEEMVEKGLLDACIINGPINNENLGHQVLSTEKVVFVTSNNLDIIDKYYDKKTSNYKRQVVDLEDFKDEAFIVLNNKYRLGKIAREIFKFYNIAPKNITVVSNMNTAISMSYSGLGVTFMPESGISLASDMSNLPIYLSLGEPDFTFPLIIAYKKDRIEDETISNFINFVKDNYKNFNINELNQKS